jgi:hypothetical protein
VVHYAGALFSFVCTLVYMWTQAIISQRVSAVNGVEDMGIAPSSARLGKVRVTMAAVATFLLGIMLVFLGLSVWELPTWGELPSGCLEGQQRGGDNSSQPWEGDWAPCVKGCVALRMLAATKRLMALLVPGPSHSSTRVSHPS